jgi:hypothetical protein
MAFPEKSADGALSQIAHSVLRHFFQRARLPDGWIGDDCAEPYGPLAVISWPAGCHTSPSPHPSPLPQGEGEASPVSRRIRDRRNIRTRRTGTLSPKRIGLDEGEQDALPETAWNVWTLVRVLTLPCLLRTTRLPAGNIGDPARTGSRWRWSHPDHDTRFRLRRSAAQF